MKALFLALPLCAKACAAIADRDYVIPDNIKNLALPALRHRIILKPEAELDGVTPDKDIENNLSQAKSPRQVSSIVLPP
ncbi:MAG: hypothetical protein LBU32_30030 [Clostridiales bacterium]|jgi:MoxR-like ATPase|nr:hypothetical protein [Clostridiales bacterium]